MTGHVDPIAGFNLRDFAEGKPCLVRIPGICNGNPETTVLAHYRLAGTCGGSLKPNDWQAAHACSACHDECDRRTRILETDFVRLCHAEGMMRTQEEVRAEMARRFGTRKMGSRK